MHSGPRPFAPGPDSLAPQQQKQQQSRQFVPSPVAPQQQFVAAPTLQARQQFTPVGLAGFQAPQRQQVRQQQQQPQFRASPITVQSAPEVAPERAQLQRPVRQQQQQPQFRASPIAVQSAPEVAPERAQLQRPVRQQQQQQRPVAAPAADDERLRPRQAPSGSFPDGFTNGLPKFEFQGRLPEPDQKSDGFMDGAQRNFPTLKFFGGFDPMPNVARNFDQGSPSLYYFNLSRFSF